MAKGKEANAGCGALFLVFLPIWWVYDTCTGGDERRATERASAQAEQINRTAARLADAKRADDAATAMKAAKERAAAELLAQQKAELASWKPLQRVQALQRCFKDDCPDGVPSADALVESAKTDGERKQL